jgi:site-specific DNA-methyltransferase (adenine-specific)
MLALIIKDFSKDNDCILDCFGGSGSTLMACEQTNRSCYMIEYEAAYIDVIIKRWEDFTGKKAELISE